MNDYRIKEMAKDNIIFSDGSRLYYDEKGECYILDQPSRKKMRIKLIKHIPHCSIEVPVGFQLKTGLSKDAFDYYNYQMSDYKVDELFKDFRGVEIRAKYSRLYCDVEKYKDDNKEYMSRFGQGYIYTRTYDGKVINRDDNDKYNIDEYYDAHHRKLDEAVAYYSNKGYTVIILDIHSFSNKQARSIGYRGPFPDICIGTNISHNPIWLLNIIIQIINYKGYEWNINYPYSGSILPNALFRGELRYKRIYSIMIEVNKRVYLDKLECLN